MNNKLTISISAPQFEQYQMVTLHWNDEEYPTKIVRRWFDADDGCWSYETTVDQPRLYPEDVLEAREE